jgi:predicted dehydrogenase
VSEKTLRVALIGLGGVNRWLFRPAIQKCADVKLVAGVSPTAASRDAFVESWPMPVYERFDQMIAREKLDAVVIGSPTHLHFEHIREAANAGLHVVVTKPLCNTVAECRDAIAATKRAGVVLHVGHEYRYRPAIRRLIELAKSPDNVPVGTATMLLLHMGHPGGLKDVPAGSWRWDASLVPGGSGNLLGVHGIDLANALFGAPRRVVASLHHLCGKLPLEDTTAFTIEYDRAIAVITTSYASYTLETANLLGTKGNLIARGDKLFLDANKQTSAIEDLATESAADCLLREFVASIREKRQPETGGETGLAAVAVLEAALAAAKQGRAVEVTASR